VYTDAAQFQEVKNNIEKIIKKNIDARIDKLGVSDYKSYYQTAGDSYYLVIEIGGISDLDQAKKTIGKTLELEFKLPNKVEPTPASVLERKTVAKDLLNQVLAQEDKFQQIADEKASANIFYGMYS
jgi:preprotein translocase subunit SecD